MFLFNWFFDVLSWLGLYYKNAKILFLGLDNAGKTTLLHMLKDASLSQHTPTSQPTKEELVMGNIRFNAYDLGGHVGVRRLWKEYSVGCDAVVYLVDAHDTERIKEAKQELDSLLASEELANVPFLILGNKIDLPESLSEPELREGLGLMTTTGKEEGASVEGLSRPIEVFMCSILRRSGYAQGFRWLSQYLK